MIKYDIDTEGIATLTLSRDDAPVNAINATLANTFSTHIQKAIEDSNVKGIILTSDKNDFIAGADIKEVYHDTPQAFIDRAMSFKATLRSMETGGKPVVAAINGSALGAGYEVCLACHHRIALNNPKTQIGLPEVTLGLLPGAGGTQRLPRLIGIQAALSLLLEGKKLRPQQALKLGVVDAMADSREDLITKAKQWIKAHPAHAQPWDEKGYKVPGGGATHPNVRMILSASAGLIQKKTYGNYPAPMHILSAVHEGVQVPFDRAAEVENRYFEQCVKSDVARNLIRTMFVHLNEANAGVARPKNFPPSNIRKVGILGAGMMGAGIAYVTAKAGIEVVLKDVSAEAALKGKKYSEDILGKLLEQGRASQSKVDEILNRITTTDKAEDVTGCDLVIEAVFEDRELKAKVTKESEAVISEHAIFASNTSTLPISGLAEASQRPEKFIGLHFFSPVDKMPLVEIIMGDKTGEEALAKSIDYVRKIRKTPIVVNDSRGFYTSRVFKTYLYEGFECLSEGIAPAIIENAGKACGMPVGPLAVADEVSIELLHSIKKQTRADLGEETQSAAFDVIDHFVEKLDRKGRKNGKGFYEYPAEGRKFLWPELKNHYVLKADQPPVEEVKKRLLHIQALEAIKCMEEQVVTQAKDADIGSILGWGVPAYTGGIISYVEGIGIKQFVSECQDFAKRFGSRFEPTKRLVQMAESGELFYN